MTRTPPIARPRLVNRLVKSARGPFAFPTSAVFFALLIVGLATRILFIFSADHHMNSDHAVVYLMARHASEGELSAFYWGQSYGGTLLQLTAGAAMVVFGKSIGVLAVISVLYWSAAAVMLRLVVMRSIGRATGDVAGILFWFPGLFLFTQSTIDPGFYGPTLILGLTAVWIVLAMPFTRPWIGWVLLGAAAGLALWTSPMALVFAAPAVVVALVKNRDPRGWAMAGIAAVITALPWLLETIRSSFSSVRPMGSTGIHIDSFASMFTDMLPTAFPLDRFELARFAVAFSAVFCLGSVIYFGIRCRVVGAALIGIGSLLVVAVLVVGSGVRLAADSARYSTFLLPVLATAVAWWVTRYRWSQWLVIVLAPLITLGPLAQKSDLFHLSTAARFDPSLTKVADELSRSGHRAVYGDYWMAYAMTALTDERVTVAALVPRRFMPYEVTAARAVDTVIVVYADQANDRLLQKHTELPTYQRTIVDGFAIFVFDGKFDPFTLPLELF